MNLRHLTARAACLVAAMTVPDLACLPPPEPFAPRPPQIDVFTGGEDGYQTYRIPSVITAPDGTLLAFAEGRREGAGDAGDIDLVLKRSTDGGASWSALEVIGDNGQNTFGNPCPVVDTTTGTIWLFSTHNRGSDPEAAIIEGTSEGTRTVWLMRSNDGGMTWSVPVEVTAATKRDDWTWYATGPGIGIQTRSGRLVIPANHAEAGTGIHRSHLLYSDDHGSTWTIGGIADPGTNESQVVELVDGRLMLNMRNHPPKPENFRMVAFSENGGETLSPARPDTTLIEPPAQASLVRWPLLAEGRSRLAFANPAAASRVRMTVRVSDDRGRTWPISRVVYEGPSAYSSLVPLPGDELGLLYERGNQTPYERITFVRMRRMWLETGP